MPMNTGSKKRTTVFVILVAVNLLALLGYLAGKLSGNFLFLEEAWPAIPLFTLCLLILINFRK